MRFIVAFFYLNYFYGICAVAMSVEYALQRNGQMPGTAVLLLTLIVPILYYSIIYVNSAKQYSTDNERLLWYRQHSSVVKIHLWWLSLVLLPLAGFVMIRYPPYLVWQDGAYVSLFCFLLLAYHGVHSSKNLRSVYWLKPFIIGTVWAGWVTIPTMLSVDKVDFFDASLFTKNWILISILAFIFDFKDIDEDKKANLKTWANSVGIVETIQYLLVPLITTTLCLSIFYDYYNHYNWQYILLNNLGLIALLLLIRRSLGNHTILDYLIVFDGLMLLKAIGGVLATLCCGA